MKKERTITQKLKYYAKEIVLFLITVTILMNVISLYKSSELNKEPLNLVNITLINGTKYSYNNDKPILIHFWATWCPICKLEASNIETISKNYEVLSIVVKSEKKDIIKYMRENHLNYNVVVDKSGFLATEFNIAAYPTTFIYDKDKNLVFSEVGYTSTFGMWIRMLWAGF